MKALVLLYAANAVLVLTLDPPCSDEEALKSIEKLVCINSFLVVFFEMYSFRIQNTSSQCITNINLYLNVTN